MYYLHVGRRGRFARWPVLVTAKVSFTVVLWVITQCSKNAREADFILKCSIRTILKIWKIRDCERSLCSKSKNFAQNEWVNIRRYMQKFYTIGGVPKKVPCELKDQRWQPKACFKRRATALLSWLDCSSTASWHCTSTTWFQMLN